MANPSRHWVWTLSVASSNLGTDDLINLINNLSNHRYSVFQKELSESGYEHYQGYTEFSKPCRPRVLKNNIHPTIHVERRQGSREQARDYYMKDSTALEEPVEIGTWISGSGHRSDLQSMKESMDQGASIAEVWDNHFPVMVKYWKSVNEYKRVRAGIRDSKTYVSLMIGATGAGKSYQSRQEAGQNVYVKPAGTKWFDAYLGQENVILDDFDWNWMPMSLMLNLMDEYELTLESKGGHVAFNAKRLWITTNLDPAVWYPSADPEQKRALYRRIDRYVICKSKNERTEIAEGEWEDRYNRFREAYDEYIRNKP